METEFEFLEHTADVGLVCYGRTLEGLFANAAKGLFSLIADIQRVEDNTIREIEVHAPDLESLLVAFLNELLYLFDSENLLFHHFEILTLHEDYLKAKAYGEKADPERHHLKLAPKAATFYKLEIKRENSSYRGQVIVDI